MARRVRVVVQQLTAADAVGDAIGRWVAFCNEPHCVWAQSPSEKTYVNHRAAAHRREHREAVDRG